mmetsp:Transcript_23216/g.53701  ORF Transcript_23216/g.53701 Transcript_23216/m.53701 type:complete len:186 (-) Transcript_23216:229-786(-)
MAHGGASANDAAMHTIMPSNALEWVRAIGLGRYAEAMRAAGIVRLEVAARITADDIKRLGVSARDAQKLLGSAQKLKGRLTTRGKLGTIPDASLDTSGYSTAMAIHYDNQTGEFWGEDGSTENSFNAPPAVIGGDGGGSGGVEGSAPPAQQKKQSAERQRARNEQNKARVANHNRKARAYRKHGP